MRAMVTFAVVLGWLLGSSQVPGQDWTRFRGPNGTGISDAKTIPATWSEKDYNWKVDLPGIGHSSPVVWGDKLFVLSADAKDATRYVLCLDTATGQKKWTRPFPSSTHHLHLRNSFASSTPTVDAERVYVAWSTPEVTTFKALTHDGSEVWSHDLGPWVSQHGFGTSPILFEDLVILSNSQDGEERGKAGQSFMMAFDAKTGKERWRTPRKSVNVSYSAPFLYQPAGGPVELICTSTGDGVYSLDPRTGQPNWSFDTFKMRTVSQPILAAGLIFGTMGSGGGGNTVYAVKPGKSASLAYEIKLQAPYVPSLVAKGDLMFLMSDKGFASCVSAADGNMIWRERLDTAFSGSPVIVDDKLYCMDESGVCWVLAAGREYKLLGKNPLGEESRSTPCVSGGRLYLRTYSHLISVGGKAS